MTDIIANDFVAQSEKLKKNRKLFGIYAFGSTLLARTRNQLIIDYILFSPNPNPIGISLKVERG